MAKKTAVKLCGQTRAADIEYSFTRGADFCGVVVEVASSPRTRTIDTARPLFAVNAKKTFALTADAPMALYREIAKTLMPGYFQLTANEEPATVQEVRKRFGIPVFKSVHLPMAAEPGKTAEVFQALIDTYLDAGADGFVLDTKTPRMFGGSGKKSDWNLAEAIIRGNPGVKILLAGGIDPQNAAEAAALAPWGIDLASGVETAPGIKSKKKIDALFVAIGDNR